MPRSWPLWIAAVVSLGTGVGLAMRPGRLDDFYLVLRWVELLRAGVTPFTPDVGADYPPWALVTLAPLAWLADVLPHDFVALAWIGLNLALSGLIVSLLVRHVPRTGEARGWLAAALLSAACFRVPGQFSILSFALALLGASTRSPIRGGVWMGLALMKPQVGGVIWLAHVVMRDWRRVATAAVVPVGLTLVCAGWLGQNPLDLIRDYAGVVRDTHGGDVPFLGHTELESWLWRGFGTGTSLTAAALIGVALMLPGIAFVSRSRPQEQDHVWEWYGFCGVVSLMATRHLSYDFLLLLPLVVAWRSTRTGFLLLVAWLVIEPPGWWRQVFEPMGLSPEFGVVVELDRLLVVGLWCLLLFRLIQAAWNVSSKDTR